MGSRRAVLAGLAAVLVALGLAPAPAGAAARAGSPRHATHHRATHHRATHHRAARKSRLRPRAFASCRALVGYARQHFAATGGRPDPQVAAVTVPTLAPVPLNSGSQGAVAPAAAQTSGASAGASGSTPEFSTTNDQEAGVDEPDVAKTDGSTIFYVAGRMLYAVAVSGHAMRLAGSLDLGVNGYGAQLLLRGHRLIVISHGGVLPGPILAPGAPGAAAPVGAPIASIAPSPYYYRQQTVVDEVDVSDPGALRITRTMTVDGSFVDARQNGSTARLVIASAPLAIADAAARARPAGWIPARSFHSFLSGRRYVRPVAGCANVDRPVQFSGLGMLTVLTLNLDKGLWTASSDALMANAQIVYGSLGSLYIATQKWVDPATPVQQLPAQTTVIEQLDASNPDTTTFVAAGEAPGYLLNQFSLSEYNGYLRVATTSRPIWWAGEGVALAQPLPPAVPSQSYVTVLQQRGGQLTQVGQVSGLGRGQQIYSVRFVGDTGYVVTFRQVDPLYVVDLASPTAPAVTGQLELAGYSAYLHPLGDGLLLGVGQDVGAGNEPSGAQLELFDVGNPRAPALLAKTTLGAGSSTPAQFDHHAFLYWAPRSLAVLPVEVWPPPSSSAPGQPTPTPGSQSRQQPFLGAIGFRVDRSGISEVGRVSHPSTENTLWPIDRSIVVGDYLFTLSQDGVMSSSLDGLGAQDFVAFPAPASVPPQPLAASSSSG